MAAWLPMAPAFGSASTCSCDASRAAVPRAASGRLSASMGAGLLSTGTPVAAASGEVPGFSTHNTPPVATNTADTASHHLVPFRALPGPA